jgi:hypothetical protein
MANHYRIILQRLLKTSDAELARKEKEIHFQFITAF